MKTDQPLPTIRITAVVQGSIMGGPFLNGKYDLIVNWDPKDDGFDPANDSLKDGGFGKRFDSWTLAYDAALGAIERISDPVVQKALRRGLTPIPLRFLRASVAVAPCGEVDFITAEFSWLFLNNMHGAADVIVNEIAGVFQGIHDTR